MLIEEDELKDMIETNNRLMDHFIIKLPEIQSRNMVKLDKYIACVLENSYHKLVAKYAEQYKSLAEIAKYFGYKCGEYDEAKLQLDNTELDVIEHCKAMKYADQPLNISDDDESNFWGLLYEITIEEINKLKEINFIIKTKLDHIIKVENNGSS